MSARRLPQPSPETTRRRLSGLLDATPDTAWDEAPDPDAEWTPSAAGQDESPTTTGSRSRVPAGSWRRETVLVACAVILVGVVLAGLVLLRSAPLEITDDSISPAAIGGTPAVQVSPAAGSASASPKAGTPTPTAAAAPLAAHVIGEVKRPGLVNLAPGARVDDAITAAGGLTSQANPGDLNLAQPLQDGQQVVVGSASKPGGEVRGPLAAAVPGGASPATTGGAKTGGAGSTGSAVGARVNLNTASALELEELPGVGPATAQKIIAWREQNGRFVTVEQLMDVPGIGPKTYADIAPRAGV